MSEHTMTVTTRIEDDEVVVESVVLTCSAPEDADCRNYPDCNCDEWHYNDDATADDAGHPRVKGRRCLFADWVENDGAEYVGEDRDDMRDDCVPAVARSGPVEIAFRGYEWPQWHWVDDPKPGGSGR